MDRASSGLSLDHDKEENLYSRLTSKIVDSEEPLCIKPYQKDDSNSF